MIKGKDTHSISQVLRRIDVAPARLILKSNQMETKTNPTLAILIACSLLFSMMAHASGPAPTSTPSHAGASAPPPTVPDVAPTQAGASVSPPTVPNMTAASVVTPAAFVPPSNADVSTAPAEAATPVPPPLEAEVRSTVILAVTLCWNESSQREDDCTAIIHIRKRSAQYHHRTLRDELLMLHSERRPTNPELASLRSDRATNPREGDARSWLGDLSDDLHQPRGWNGTPAEWARTASQLRTLVGVVEGVIAGTVDDPCGGRAFTWGGRRIDAVQIQSHLAAGRMVVDCGRTANAFIGNVPGGASVAPRVYARLRPEAP